MVTNKVWKYIDIDRNNCVNCTLPFNEIKIGIGMLEDAVENFEKWSYLFPEHNKEILSHILHIAKEKEQLYNDMGFI
jgi:hypothetical protein